MRLRLATWNINSVRLRLDLVERFVRAENPDILCLQEIKCEEAQFPRAAFEAMGFPFAAVTGQKGYHGVATLSKVPLAGVGRLDLCGDNHARHVSVMLAEGASISKPLTLHNFYVPAGGDVPDPAVNDKFRHKLDFLDALTTWSGAHKTKSKNRMILVGDLNVAPLEADVWSHKQLLKVVSHTPPETERMAQALASHDWIDVMRQHVPPEEKLFTWWSYRNRDWRVSNRGRRLDHVWMTPALEGAATSMRVLEQTRDWERTSDHVPVIVDLEID